MWLPLVIPHGVRQRTSIKEEAGKNIEDKGKDDNGNLHKGTFYTY